MLVISCVDRRKKVTQREHWVTWGQMICDSSDVGMVIELFGFDERITVGEPVERNVVVFDL